MRWRRSTLLLLTAALASCCYFLLNKYNCSCSINSSLRENRAVEIRELKASPPHTHSNSVKPTPLAFYYDEFPIVDVEGADLANIISKDISVLKRVCNALPECKGFNANGWLKSSVSHRIVATTSLFVKIASRNIDQRRQRLSGDLLSANSEARMLQSLRVFVYRPPERLRVPAITDYKYSIESLFEKLLRESAVRTDNPDEADFFFVPVRCAAHRFSVTSRNEGQQRAELAMKELIDYIIESFPDNNRNGWADHFYLCTHDMGASCAAAADPLFRKNAIALLNTAEYTDPFFAPHKDISIPPNPGEGCPTCTQGHAAPLLPTWHNRTLLAFFAGNMAHGSLRPMVLRMWGHDPDLVIVDGMLPSPDYHAYLHRARFCLLLRGHRGWSPRLMDAVWAGCVPAIVADHYHLPLQGVVDWATFSVIVPERRLGQLKDILLQVSPERYAQMQRNIAGVMERFVWNDPPQPRDAFHSVLLQLWQRRSLLRYH